MSAVYRPNRLPCYGKPLGAEDAAGMDAAAAASVARLLALCPAHRPTPLHELPALAGELRIGRLFVKDESMRLGLGSFKALGGAYAVLRVCLDAVSKRLGRTIEPADIAQPDFRSAASTLTVACASDGNHGKSVAAGARFTGCRAVVYLHSGVSAERAGAIERYGAEVRRVPGVYGDAVATAARECAVNGWTLVSDTATPGDERIPGMVMQGYTVMLSETLEQMPATPTHVFVQAGVGGLAAAVAAHLTLCLADERPRIVLVEPARAACLLASHDAGRRLAIPAGKPTIMAMLECQEPSLSAWRVLSRLADGFMTIDEDDAARAMTRLAKPHRSDPAIVSGESGAAGLAGLLVAAASGEMREAIDLHDDAVLLAFNTEGATDRQSYRRLTGCDPDHLARRASVQGVSPS